MYLYVGSTVPFTKQSGFLIFGEESVQRINLTLNNDTLEVHTFVSIIVYTYIYVCMYFSVLTLHQGRLCSEHGRVDHGPQLFYNKLELDPLITSGVGFMAANVLTTFLNSFT